MGGYALSWPHPGTGSNPGLLLRIIIMALDWKSPACLHAPGINPAAMPVRLVVTLKQSVRRCLYRRWEGQVVGRELRTKTVALERMYRGNTPYPIGRTRRTAKVYASHAEGARALKVMAARRRARGYRVA